MLQAVVSVEKYYLAVIELGTPAVAQEKQDVQKF